MSGFVVPLACDARGRLVTPAAADKGAAYRCPGCDAPLDLHSGEKKRRHFHHRAGTSSCTAESTTHLSAKRLVAQAIDDWLAGSAAAPVFVRACAQTGCSATTRQPMPKKVGRVVLEHRLPSGHVADIALLPKIAAIDLPVGVIEIRHTHAVDEEKAFELGIPWIELAAEQVCADEGRVLVAVRDRFVPWLCTEHAHTRGVDRKSERLDRERAAAAAQRLDYRPADFPGYRIARVVTCPNGHEAIVFAWDGRWPPDPRPPHVVAVERDLDPAFDRVGGWKRVLPYRRSYVSVCPSCRERLE